ncbi:MAG: SemiSWEET transporter [Desulfuromonadales bacterium]|nr:SemiSWEET transporter [Desulfuromonadales bacterium]
MNPTSLGLIAGTLTSIASVPQLVKILRTRHARDISVWQPLLLSVGVALWLVYGMLIHDTPLILANIVPLICNIMLTILKLRYRNDAVV